ncbi:MAG: hypothetical protein ABH865_06875, partial [Candidatus Omnitrophota bacterium]
RLDRNSVLVLAIYRKADKKETFIGAPAGDIVIRGRDVLICYSRLEGSKILLRKDREATEQT